jgi:hypothetical protein
LILINLYRAASTPDVSYFEEVSFGETRERVVMLVLHGLLNGEKAQPQFVHAAPINKEVDMVCRTLEEAGFATLYGGPGEGKSMTAYHVAYRLQMEKGYSPYTLRVDLLTDRGLPALRDELQAQLDGLRGKRKLIIVDDAHKLADRIELNRLMRDEASDAEIRVIWVETEFYQETASERPTSHVRIDFRSFVDQLVENLYRRRDVTFEFALRGQIEGLEEALRKAANNQIRDAWHFAFVASQGEKRVEEEISKLDYVETLTLFLISAHTILTGERELPTAGLMNILVRLKFGWLIDTLRRRSLIDIVRSLQEHRFESHPDKQTMQRMSLIRLYDKTVNDRGYIASLHYNSAKAIIGAALLKANIVEDLLESLKLFLVFDYRRCSHISVLLRSMKPQQNALAFVSSNEQWFVGFLSNLKPDMMQAYPPLLDSLKSLDPQVYTRIINKLDVDCIAQQIDAVDSSKFHGLAYLLRALKGRQHILFEKVAWQDLASRVESADVSHFSQVAELLGSIGNYRKVLVDKIDWQNLAFRVAKADIVDFKQIAELLNTLGNRRDILLEKIIWPDLAYRVANADVPHFSNIAELLRALGDRRDELVNKIDWQNLALRIADADVFQFTQIADLLGALRDHRDALVDKIEWRNFALRIASADVTDFGQIASLLEMLGNRRTELLARVNWTVVARRIRDTADLPDLQSLGQLLVAMGADRSLLVEKLARNGGLVTLASKISKSPADRFEQVAVFLSSLDRPLPPLDTSSLVRTASECSRDNLKGLTLLMSSLDDVRRQCLLEALDWTQLSMRCSIRQGMLGALGQCLENVRKKDELSSDSSGCEKVGKYLRGNVGLITVAVVESYRLGKASGSFYSGIAKFLHNCNLIDEILTFQIVEQTIETAVRDFTVIPANHRYVSQLIDTFYEVYPGVARSFVENRRIQNKITSSLNNHDWAGDPDGVRRLIQTVYRACPAVWFKILTRITTTLSEIDLEAIYKEVAESALASAVPDPE